MLQSDMRTEVTVETLPNDVVVFYGTESPTIVYPDNIYLYPESGIPVDVTALRYGRGYLVGKTRQTQREGRFRYVPIQNMDDISPLVRVIRERFGTCRVRLI